MIHCQFVSAGENKRIIEQFQLSLETETGEESRGTGPRQLVSHRHGAVLGLCSVVTAFPHTVPASVPPLLVYLGKFLHDRQPIPGDEDLPFIYETFIIILHSHHQEECPELEENSPGQLESAQTGLH